MKTEHRWMMGKNGRLQTVPNAVGGCTVIIDESIRHNPYRSLLIAAPELLEALIDLKAQVEKFAEENGEADFYTGKARDAIAKVQP